MGLPAFIIGAGIILGSSGGGGGGGEEAAPVVPTPDDFATWSAANKPDSDFNTQFTGYVNYLNEDQFGLTADERLYQSMLFLISRARFMLLTRT